MFGRQAIFDGEGSHASGTAGLSHHTAMTDDRTRAITPTVKEHQHARSAAARNDRPFPLEPAEIDGFKPYIIGNWPGRADFIDPLSPFAPAPRARFRC